MNRLHFCSLHQGLLLYCDYQPSSFDMSKHPSRRFEAMDHFAKCFLIMRLHSSRLEGGVGDKGDRPGWRAVRVDLVSPPMDCYAFALLGWSGSRVGRVPQSEKIEESLVSNFCFSPCSSLAET